VPHGDQKADRSPPRGHGGIGVTDDVPAVLAELRAGDAFKFNVGPVLIDFLIRHGVIGPDTETGYPELCRALRSG